MSLYMTYMFCFLKKNIKNIYSTCVHRTYRFDVQIYFLLQCMSLIKRLLSDTNISMVIDCSVSLTLSLYFGGVGCHFLYISLYAIDTLISVRFPYFTILLIQLFKASPIWSCWCNIISRKIYLLSLLIMI